LNAEIRSANAADTKALAALRYKLWPDDSLDGHAADLDEFFAGDASHLPLENFVAVSPDGEIIGFVEVGLRSHANGCDPHYPIGFLEGWFVVELHRRRGIGTALVRAAEDWARSQGCKEMASDAPVENTLSHLAHKRLGYAVADICVDFRKQL
jgi:aminoglycoside 6'-N-acetyltransferase I